MNDANDLNNGSDDLRLVFCYDANGNVGQVVDWAATSTSNGLKARCEYDAYGNVICPDADGGGDWRDDAATYALANPYRFSTKPWDDETGMGCWGYRYYEPRMGRWISRDPADEGGSANLYAYLSNDPVGDTDLLGLLSLAMPPSGSSDTDGVCCLRVWNKTWEWPWNWPWKGKGSVGHASLECGGTYMSFWPDNPGVSKRRKTAPGAKNDSHSADISSMGRRADSITCVSCLDINKVSEKWDALNASIDSGTCRQFDLTNYNCSNVALALIQAGLSGPNCDGTCEVPYDACQKELGNHGIAVTRPEAVRDYFKEMAGRDCKCKGCISYLGLGGVRY